MSGRRRSDDPTLHGVLLVDKPAGPTSHDVVGWVRWVLGVRRVGHAGTLDPAATGLLVLGVGAATKLAPYLTGQDKRYQARFVLGASTTTADAEGSIVDEAPCPADLEARVPAALESLTAVRALPPPIFSAIHVEGRRAHELARAGQAPVLEERPMEVRRLVPGPVRRRGDRVEVEADLLVSKGTYVRSLAEALGRLLGVPAHLGALHRTHSGALGLDHPRALGGLVAERVELEPRAEGTPGPLRWRLRLPACDTPTAAAAELRAHLLACSDALPMPVLRASDDPGGRRALARLAAGQTLSLPDPGLPAAIPPAISPALPAATSDAPCVGVASPDGGALIIARLDPGGLRLRPERVVVPPPAHP